MSALSLTAASVPGLLSATSMVASHPSPTSPMIWITETVSRIVPVVNTPASTMESPILSSINQPVSPPHPLVIIPILPVPSVSSPSSTEIRPALSTITKLLTVTETLTVTVLASPSTVPPPPPPPPSTPPPPSSSTSTSTQSIPIPTWRAPAQMDDLSAFNISKFGGGRQNLAIVQGVPTNAIDPTLISESFNDLPPSGGDWGSSSVLQLLYPAGSINPAQRPVGGAQFYATPLDLTGARNVSLSYKVFFPADFEWVRAGKLPGLYGGHVGCSGGNRAMNCFSTRLMWRSQGKGELYLYAPKDAQTESLCLHPLSVCDAAYGFSIGRGSFTWGRGAWTTVQQTVTLNTPGEQDGSFTLDVNGERVIERNDVFYRGVPSRATHSIGTGEDHQGLGGLLGTLLSDLLRRAPETEAGGPTPTAASGYGDDVIGVMDQMYQAQREWAIQVAAIETDSTFTTTPMCTTPCRPTITQQPTTPPSFPDPAQQVITIVEDDPPVGFIGLFFSTFFGGHDYRYATPKDQYVWFKDFAMSYNS